MKKKTKNIIICCCVGVLVAAGVVTTLLLTRKTDTPVDSSRTLIVLDKSEITLIAGERATIKASGYKDGAIIWSSSDENAVFVDSDGIVLACDEGHAVVSATDGISSASCTVKVSARPITSDLIIVVSENVLNLKVFDTARLSVAGFNATDKALWSSDDASIATVDENGLVAAAGSGVCTITVSVGALSDECEVTVSDKIEITLEKPTEYLLKGNSRNMLFALFVNGVKGDDDLVDWTSSDASVVSVDRGVVTGKSDGVAKITASFGDVCRSAEYEVKMSLSTAEDFKNLKKTGRYIVANDIDFENQLIPCVAPYGQTSADGVNTEASLLKINTFDGSIDGNGYSLYNVNPWAGPSIAPWGVSPDSMHSLFGVIGKTGSIKNLSVYARTSSRGGNTAPIAAVNLGIIENVFARLTVYKDGINENNQNGGLVIDNRGTVKNCVSEVVADDTMKDTELLFTSACFGKLIRHCNVFNCFSMSQIKNIPFIGQVGNKNNYNIIVSNSDVYYSVNNLILSANMTMFDGKLWAFKPSELPKLKKNYLGV